MMLQARPTGLPTVSLSEYAAVETPVAAAPLRCIVCDRPFDFAAGESAVVIRHIAYGYDVTHDDACLNAALEWIFVEPGYDRPAFCLDDERTRIVGMSSAEGWSAVMPESAQRALGGDAVRFEPLRCWAVVEHRDGSRRIEGIVRDADWDEAGGAEFPEAVSGVRKCIGYASREDQLSPARRAQWTAFVQARYRGEPVPVSAPLTIS